MCSLFSHQRPLNPLDGIIGHVKPNVRSGLFRSLIAGGLLLVAYLQKSSFKQPTALTYCAVIVLTRLYRFYHTEQRISCTIPMFLQGVFKV